MRVLVKHEQQTPTGVTYGIQLNETRTLPGIPPKTKWDPRYATSGRLSPIFVACSKAYASSRTPQSSLCRPTIWIPIGKPLSENAQGAEMAGFPTIEM